MAFTWINQPSNEQPLLEVFLVDGQVGISVTKRPVIGIDYDHLTSLQVFLNHDELCQLADLLMGYCNASNP